VLFWIWVDDVVWVVGVSVCWWPLLALGGCLFVIAYCCRCFDCCFVVLGWLRCGGVVGGVLCIGLSILVVGFCTLGVAMW